MQQYRLGVDIGSTTVKIAILDPDKKLLFPTTVDTTQIFREHWQTY